jgi:RNAse (barnase) inhibitor barstar
MMDLSKLFATIDYKFHIFEANEISYEFFIGAIKKVVPQSGYLAEIDGKSVSMKWELLDAFKKAFKFPDYFGYNWDALNECINDLKWLEAASYVFVLKNPEMMGMSAEDQEILIDILKKAMKYWGEGRTFNPSFQTPPTPFHIIFAVNQGKSADMVKHLKGILWEKVLL